MSLIIFLQFLIFLPTIAGFVPPWMFMGRPLTGFRQIDTIDLLDAPEAEWFDQYLDHFNSKNGIKWRQRFWHNDKYAKKDGPQFLILGGDAPATPLDVTFKDFPHVQYAMEVNAGLWTLEHRFYGQSQPFENLDTENLIYLNSRQAVADIAYFIEFQNQNLTNPKWIIFGGSYSGSLALWFKEMYPYLSVGVVSSSAPMYFKLDFYKYLKHVEDVIKSYDDSNYTCFNNIQTGFKSLFSFINNRPIGKLTLTTSFSLNPSLVDLDFTFQNVGFFFSSIISFFQIPIQYNNVNTELFRQKISVLTLCENLRNPYGIDSDGVFNYFDSALFVANITKYLHPDYNKVDISYSDMISYLQQNDSKDHVQASTRAWTWQVCNEFGNFITTTGGKIVFGSHVSQNFYVGVCIDVFGKDYSITKTQAGMELNRKHFGNSLNYNATNVIAARGSDDPWGLLTLTESNNPTISIYSINDTGHCGDMAPPSKNDSDSLKQFRKDVVKKIKEWIKKDDF